MVHAVRQFQLLLLSKITNECAQYYKDRIVDVKHLTVSENRNVLGIGQRQIRVNIRLLNSCNQKNHARVRR